jgi:hypothetical protein
MGRCNRREAEQFYAWERVIDRFDDVYEQVIAAEHQPQEAHLPQLN